ncbi:uncharacterized protein RCH25_053308 [Pelodytes ibericus]
MEVIESEWMDRVTPPLTSDQLKDMVMVVPTELTAGWGLASVIMALPVKHDLYCATASSVLIPGVEISNKSYHELKKLNSQPDWVAQYHDGPLLHLKYEHRGRFLYQNGSFLLENLTKADSGVYLHMVNLEPRVETKVTVMDAVERPVLQRKDDDDCLIYLECVGSGGNVTFFLRGVLINETNTAKDNVLLRIGTDPQSWGPYICELRNQVSFKTSQALEIHPIGWLTWLHLLTRLSNDVAAPPNQAV